MDKKTDGQPLAGKKELKDAEKEVNAVETLKKNKKLITWTLVLILAVVIAILVYILVSNRNARKADEAIGEADAIELNDSLALVKYQAVAEMGHDAGQRAKLNCAILYYQNGRYQDAADYLKSASIKDPLIEAGQYSLLGDCYVNLKDYDKALDTFDEALDAADENPELTPVILIKKAHIYRAQNKFDKEAECYQTIVDDYPAFCNETMTDYTKFVERAKASAPAGK